MPAMELVCLILGIFFFIMFIRRWIVYTLVMDDWALLGLSALFFVFAIIFG